MTEDKPIAKPIIDDATREKMALMFSGEVYLPDDVDGFLICRPPSVILQPRLNATPLTNPKRRTELMQAFFGAAGRVCTSNARCMRTGLQYLLGRALLRQLQPDAGGRW